MAVLGNYGSGKDACSDDVDDCHRPYSPSEIPIYRFQSRLVKIRRAVQKCGLQ
jgi:hypothetical protein